MALWIGDDNLEFRGATAVANGWFQRAARLLERLDPCPEHGWLDTFRAHLVLRTDPARAEALGARARELGTDLGDVDLEMFGLATEGLALVNQGEVVDGMRCLDEAVAAALGGEFEQLAPAGWTCCYMIYACERVRDYDRAAQWCGEVEAFSRRTHIRFVNGTCRAHYAGVLVWAGDWDNAERVLVDALEDLTATRPFWRSEAVVRLAVLRRRQGRPSEARELFAQAEHHALADLGVGELRLEAGDAAGAREDMERVLRQLPAENMTTRAAPLELLVRALAALGEPESAAAHVEELESIAAAVPTLPMRASASLAAGVVAAAAGDGETARRHLQDAIELFAKGGAPFETAHARLELADVLVAMNHEDEAAHEAAAALERCDELGAAAQGARARALLARLRHTADPHSDGPLTPRQLEVLRLVADGLGNGQIADRLGLSKHTVHRHLQNAYGRLGCRSRAAAVAAAHRLELL